MYTVNQPALVLAVVLAFACSLSAPHKQTSSHRRRRTLPLQWRDPCISSLLLLLLLLLLLSLQLFVLRRHSERSEESFEGERSDPSAFLFHRPNPIISTGAAHSFIVSRAAEKPASPPTSSPNPNRRLCL